MTATASPPVTTPTGPAGAAGSEPLDAEDRSALADLAFAVGRRYADRRFADLDAAQAHWKEVCEAGLPAISLPPEHGGAGTTSDLLLVAERLAAGGYPAGKLTISTAIGGAVILRHGSPEQRDRWLPAIGDGSLRFCFALTEPGAGSNAANMRTTATRTDDGGWRINGEKTYISAADDSDVMIVVAKDAESGGFSLLSLPLPCEQLQMTPSTCTSACPSASGRSTSTTSSCRPMPSSAPPGRGPGPLRRAQPRAPHRGGAGRRHRPLVPGAGGGVRRRADRLRRAHRRAPSRPAPLAEALIDLEAAWALIERGAEVYEAGGNAGLACNMAKVKACDAGLKAADAALQTFGGSGFTGETLMFERFGYLRLLRSTPVSREMALNQVAVAGLGLPRSY
ncbi:acyl-CoA dehydrogenase family protein [Nocardioides zeae]